MNKEILRRRTFAIVSHPDAGKTTLTEKFLLFGGQIQVAGAPPQATGWKSKNNAASLSRHRSWNLTMTATK